MKHHRAGDGERTLAVFIDFENLALGFHGKRDRFQIHKVLERLVEKGKIVAKKAYADWSRFGNFAGSLHESAIELIEIPKRSMTGKNSADIRLVVDAVDLAYSKDHIDTFVIVSGDSDFSPLVSKLKELGKHVIGLGLVEATSHLLRDNCDEFIYYEDLDRPAPLAMGEMPQLPETKRKAFGLLLESLLALRRENKETIFSSMAKDTMKRKRPSFNEEYHGYRTFSELLEDAARYGLIEIEKHRTSGTYVISRFGGEIRLPGGQTQPLLPQALPHPQPMALPQQPLPMPDREPRQRQQPRPAALPPRPPQPTPAPPPVPAPSAKPSAKPPAEPDDEPALGRSLLEDVSLDEDIADELPSYGAGKQPMKRATTPPRGGSTAKGTAKPAGQPKQADKPRTAKPKPAAKPAASDRGGGEQRQSKSGGQRGGGGRKPTAASPPPPPPPPAKKHPPKPKVDDEDSFGAGLDD